MCVCVCVCWLTRRRANVALCVLCVRCVSCCACRCDRLLSLPLDACPFVSRSGEAAGEAGEEAEGTGSGSGSPTQQQLLPLSSVLAWLCRKYLRTKVGNDLLQQTEAAAGGSSRQQQQAAGSRRFPLAVTHTLYIVYRQRGRKAADRQGYRLSCAKMTNGRSSRQLICAAQQRILTEPDWTEPNWTELSCTKRYSAVQQCKPI